MTAAASGRTPPTPTPDVHAAERLANMLLDGRQTLGVEIELARHVLSLTAPLAAAEARLAETERQRDEAHATIESQERALEMQRQCWGRNIREREAAEASAARAEEALREEMRFLRSQRGMIDRSVMADRIAAALSAGAEGTASVRPDAQSFTTPEQPGPPPVT